MKTIPLTKGKYALVDDEDFELISEYKWKFQANGYACRSVRIFGDMPTAYMHRVIMNCEKWVEVDHIDGIKLNNQKHNLRRCTSAQNSQYVPKTSRNTSGFKGVSRYRKYDVWRARISVKGKQIVIGHFRDKLTAALAYNAAALKLHGPFASINRI